MECYGGVYQSKFAVVGETKMEKGKTFRLCTWKKNMESHGKAPCTWEVEIISRETYPMLALRIKADFGGSEIAKFQLIKQPSIQVNSGVVNPKTHMLGNWVSVYSK